MSEKQGNRAPKTNNRPQVIILSQDHAIIGRLRRTLVRRKHRLLANTEGQPDLSEIMAGRCDAAVVDFRSQPEVALALIGHLRAARPELPILAIGTEGRAPAIIRVLGNAARLCLSEPFDPDDTADKIIQAIDNAHRREPVPSQCAPSHNPNSSITCPLLLGQSQVMKDVFDEIKQIARFDLDVLLLGETGTGKELLARKLHYDSTRSEAPFIAVNCPGIPDTLFTSELFGAERGAFTGAEKLKIGWFERANCGTLFLDEIGDLSLACQAALLRAIQEKAICRVGGRELIPLDVRLIAATNVNLSASIETGAFRRDLYHRIERYIIRIPPLRDRGEDIEPLVKHFLDEHRHAYNLGHTSFDSGALDLLRQQSWPGNVRELNNLVLQALLSAQGAPVTRATITLLLSRKDMGSSSRTMPQRVADVLARVRRGSLEGGALDHLSRELERETISQSIHLAQGNQSLAARWLGISRNTLAEKLRALQLI